MVNESDRVLIVRTSPNFKLSKCKCGFCKNFKDIHKRWLQKNDNGGCYFSYTNYNFITRE